MPANMKIVFLFAMISLIMSYEKYTNPDSWKVLNITYLLLLFTYFITLLLTVCTVYYIVSRLCGNYSAMYIYIVLMGLRPSGFFELTIYVFYSQ